MHEQISLCLFTLSFEIHSCDAVLPLQMNHSNTQVPKSKMLSPCEQFTIGTFRYDLHHFCIASMFSNQNHQTTYQLPNIIYQYQRIVPPSCIIIHPANPKKSLWGTQQEVKGDLKAPATHKPFPPPHPSSPSSPRLQQGLCVLAPVQVLALWWGGSQFVSDLGPAC